MDKYMGTIRQKTSKDGASVGKEAPVAGRGNAGSVTPNRQRPTVHNMADSFANPDNSVRKTK
jgi:hypothetical protein